MESPRRKKILLITMLLGGITIGITLILYALRQNIDLYYTPTQLKTVEVSASGIIRVGGIVVKNSVKHFSQKAGVHFEITDYSKTVDVEYNGILPTLFREGQGVIVEGEMNKKGTVIATQVLAKHDSNYKPNIKIIKENI